MFTEEPLPEKLLEQMPKLKWLHVTRGGLSAYLTPLVRARPIEVTGSKGIHGTVFSEFALACILALAKKLPECIAGQTKRRWQKLAPIEVEGKTLGIVGLGIAGNALARKAKALGLGVIATKRTPTAKPDYVDELGTSEFLPWLLSRSDFVVLLLASIPSTVNIIGEKELRSMKKSAYLINLTGGQAIEERLLIQALKETGSPARCWTRSRASPCRKIRSSGNYPMLSLARESAASPKNSGRRFCRSSSRT